MQRLRAHVVYVYRCWLAGWLAVASGGDWQSTWFALHGLRQRRVTEVWHQVISSRTALAAFTSHAAKEGRLAMYSSSRH